MRLPNDELHAYFREIGVTRLYHANTVATSITYLQQGGLLSRGAVESLGYFQTAQDSDRVDKVVKVWNDIFFDSVDLHGLFPRQNFYGPVSFQFSVDLVLLDNLAFWITKNNPQYWNKTTPMEQRFFQSVEELRVNKEIPTHRKMITIRGVDIIDFTFLERVVIDNPNLLVYQEYVLKNEAISALRAVQSEELAGRFFVRNNTECKEQKCYCHDNYLRLHVNTLTKLFLPPDHPRFEV